MRGNATAEGCTELVGDASDGCLLPGRAGEAVCQRCALTQEERCCWDACGGGSRTSPLARVEALFSLFSKELFSLFFKELFSHFSSAASGCGSRHALVPNHVPCGRAGHICAVHFRGTSFMEGRGMGHALNTPHGAILATNQICLFINLPYHSSLGMLDRAVIAVTRTTCQSRSGKRPLESKRTFEKLSRRNVRLGTRAWRRNARLPFGEGEETHWASKRTFSGMGRVEESVWKAGWLGRHARGDWHALIFNRWDCIGRSA